MTQPENAKAKGVPQFIPPTREEILAGLRDAPLELLRAYLAAYESVRGGRTHATIHLDGGGRRRSIRAKVLTESTFYDQPSEGREDESLTREKQ